MGSPRPTGLTIRRPSPLWSALTRYVLFSLWRWIRGSLFINLMCPMPPSIMILLNVSLWSNHQGMWLRGDYVGMSSPSCYLWFEAKPMCMVWEIQSTYPLSRIDSMWSGPYYLSDLYFCWMHHIGCMCWWYPCHWEWHWWNYSSQGLFISVSYYSRSRHSELFFGSQVCFLARKVGSQPTEMCPRYTYRDWNFRV